MEIKQATFLTFMILLICLPALAQRKPDRYRDGLKGPVKRVSLIKMARLVNESGTWVEQPPFEVGGDSNYDLEGYGPLGKHPGGEGYNMSPSGEHGESTFDEAGNKSMTMHYSGTDQPIGKDLYIYDSNGNEIEEHRYKFDGQSWTMWQRTVSTYDERDIAMSKLTYNGDGELESRWLYYHDGNGHLIDEYLYTGPQTCKEHRIYKYELDSLWNWTKRTMYQEMMEDVELVPGTVTHQGEWVPKIVTYREIEYYKGWPDMLETMKRNRPEAESGL